MGSHTATSESQQQYCLRWNNYQNNLTNVLDQLLQAEAFCDVTLSAEGHTLKAHKVILSVSSPYFQALFADHSRDHPIVILNGVSWAELKSVVEFVYRGEISVASDHLPGLLKVAELLKIRGLADVSHSRNNALNPIPKSQSSSSSSANAGSHSDLLDKRPNPADFLSHSAQSNSGSESPSVNGHGRRKRRKISTPERTPSPPHPHDTHDHGDDDSASVPEGDGGMDDGMSMSVDPIPPSVPSVADIQCVLGSNSSGIGPTLLNLHAAAAAMAASGGGPGTSSSAAGGGSSSSSGGAGDMDIKPGIVEMIREEERAKMLETAHSWLGTGNATLSDSYQYQIQNLWQKCWNQNQGGMMHALRFRERGPLKSWRPETMAEAIFAVLKEGLSLSQAARKYDIPYPTFVLYANRVHNMLGPSADGSTSSDLMSDMRPKGRGRPQRILLGTWPEEHIRGVIRAVVFRDTQTKDDIPFVFNRDGSLCFPQPGALSSATPTQSQQNISASTSNSQNGVDMSLHPPFGFGSRSSAVSPTQGESSQSQQQPPRTTSASSSSSSGSPLQQALNSAGFSLNLQAAAQSQLLAFQQQAHNHFQKIQQQMQRKGESVPSSLSLMSGGGGGKGKTPAFSLGNLTGLFNPGMKQNLEGMKDLFQIKHEFGSFEENDDINEQEGNDQSQQEGDGIDDGEECGEMSPSCSNQQRNPTDLRCSPLDKANNNEKSVISNEDDMGPASMVQVQMDQGSGSSEPKFNQTSVITEQNNSSPR